MGLLKWFERKLFTGDVLQDYGTMQDERKGITRLRTSVLLCRKDGKLQLIFRQTATAPLGARVSYAAFDLTSQNLQLLENIVQDAKQKLTTSNLPPPLC